MNATPVICFGQQPCGFFPRRYLYAKIATARRLQAELGGEIVYFCHDSDHDFRETRTTLRHRKTGEPIQLNFAFDNQIQRKFSPLYLKRVRDDWHARTADQLRAYVDPCWVEAFRAVEFGSSRISAWRCTGRWACSRACALPGRAIRRSVSRRASRRLLRRRAVRGRDRAGPAHRRPAQAVQGGRPVRGPARCSIYSRADQPDSRYAAALDAIGGSLHALRGGCQRAGLPPEGRRAEITYVVRDMIERADEAYVEPPT